MTRLILWLFRKPITFPRRLTNNDWIKKLPEYNARFPNLPDVRMVHDAAMGEHYNANVDLFNKGVDEGERLFVERFKSRFPR